MAKVALRIGCAKQSKNLEWYLLDSVQPFDLKVLHIIDPKGKVSCTVNQALCSVGADAKIVGR